MNKNDHVIFDFETIGAVSSRCPALDLSAFKFKWDRFTSNEPYTFNEIIRESRTWKFDIKAQVKENGWSYTKDDLQFWADQPAHVREQIKPKSDDISLKEFCKDYSRWLEKPVDFWWSRSNMFDPVIIERIFIAEDKHNQFRYLHKYWAVRDTRTWIDSKLGFDTNNFIPMKDEKLWNKYFNKHNSKHDIAADLLRLQACARAEKNLD